MRVVFLLLAYCTALANSYLVVIDATAASPRDHNCTETAECQEIDRNSVCVKDTCDCSTGYHLTANLERWYCARIALAPELTTVEPPAFRTPPRYNVITVVVIIAVIVIALVFLISKWSLYFYFPCCMGPRTQQMLHDGPASTGFPTLPASRELLDRRLTCDNEQERLHSGSSAMGETETLVEAQWLGNHNVTGSQTYLTDGSEPIQDAPPSYAVAVLDVHHLPTYHQVLGTKAT